MYAQELSIENHQMIKIYSLKSKPMCDNMRKLCMRALPIV